MTSYRRHRFSGVFAILIVVYNQWSCIHVATCEMSGFTSSLHGIVLMLSGSAVSPSSISAKLTVSLSCMTSRQRRRSRTYAIGWSVFRWVSNDSFSLRACTRYRYMYTYMNAMCKRILFKCFLTAKFQRTLKYLYAF